MAETASNKKKARIAGLLYLMVVLTGIFSLMYVPSRIMVANNPALTYQNITTFQPLFRLGIVSGLLCYTFFLFLPLALYRLLKPVSETHAVLMVLLAVAAVPVYFINIQNEFSVLSLVSGSGHIKDLSPGQIQSQVLLYLDQFDNGMRIVHIFSGLWLFPFGYLVFKSNFLPKILGVLLMLGCIGYLFNFLANTLIPAYSKTGISSFVSLPASLGEIGICLWLLIVGAKGNKTA